MTFDFSILLDNVESIVASIVAILTLLSTLALFIGKLKLAKKFKTAAEEIKEHEKEILDATQTVQTIIEGIEQVKTVFRPKLVKKELNAGAIIEAHADKKGLKEILNKYVERFTTEVKKPGA